MQPSGIINKTIIIVTFENRIKFEFDTKLFKVEPIKLINDYKESVFTRWRREDFDFQYKGDLIWQLCKIEQCEDSGLVNLTIFNLTSGLEFGEYYIFLCCAPKKFTSGQALT